MDLKNVLIEAYATPDAERRQPLPLACTIGDRIIATRGTMRIASRQAVAEFVRIANRTREK